MWLPERLARHISQRDMGGDMGTPSNDSVPAPHHLLYPLSNNSPACVLKLRRGKKDRLERQFIYAHPNAERDTSHI